MRGIGSLLDRWGVSRDIVRPAHLAAFALSATSIASLLLYFTGILSLRAGVLWLLLPGTALLAAWYGILRRTGSGIELRERLAAGLWAGSFATLLYDLVRVPIPYSGIPVFKAISYFGTLLLDVQRPSPLSEVVGWTYHLSNGIGFALMYTLLFRRAHVVTAVLWGITLEGAMLLTPYAEVFGYKRTPQFMAITVGAHVFYGLGLWLALRWRERRAGARRFGWRPAAAWMIGPLLIAGIAAEFYRLHAATIPASPPFEIGRGLLVSWSTPEPDRIGAIWLMKRYVQPDARFHFVEPMSQVRFGTPFDVPDAEIRRGLNESTFEVVLKRTGKAGDPALQALAEMCHYTEITPWALASKPQARQLAASINARLADCRDLRVCLDAGLAWFDEEYAALSKP